MALESRQGFYSPLDVLQLIADMQHVSDTNYMKIASSNEMLLQYVFEDFVDR